MGGVVCSRRFIAGGVENEDIGLASKRGGILFRTLMVRKGGAY